MHSSRMRTACSSTVVGGGSVAGGGMGSLCTGLLCPGADPGFGQGGPQVLRPKVAGVVKRSHASEVSNLWPGSRARLRALEAFFGF